MSTLALQNSSNAFPPTFAGHDIAPNAVDLGRKNIPPPKSLLQRVQESDSKNWLYYQLFLRQDFDACDISLAASEENEQLVQSTYAIYMKGLIAKRKGKLMDALTCMKECHDLDRRNLEVLKELISLSFLTRGYQEALNYAELAKALQPSQDWSLVYHQGLCYERLGNLTLAHDYLKSAITIQPQEKAYIALAEFHIRHNSYEDAVEVLDRAKRVFPDSLVLSARLGRLQIKNQKDLNKGFGNLAQASSGSKTQEEPVLLAVGSVLQQKLDLDGALKKYEVILQDGGATSAAVLNNIGLCCLAKPRKSVAVKKDGKSGGAGEDEYSLRVLQAVGCLKKAQQMAPLDWKIAGNLGYLMRELRLYATSSYYLMASIRLAQKNPSTEAYLILAGVANKLDIESQANQVYKYAVRNNNTRDPLVYLNYATFLLRQGEKERATEMAIKCRDAIAEWEHAGRTVETFVVEMLRLLKTKLPIPVALSHPVVQSIPIAGISDGSPNKLDQITSSSHELVVSAQVEHAN